MSVHMMVWADQTAQLMMGSLVAAGPCNSQHQLMTCHVYLHNVLASCASVAVRYDGGGIP